MSERRRRLPSMAVAAHPVRAFACVAGAVFVAEFFLMWLLRRMIPAGGAVAALIDAGALLAAMVPLLYFLLVRPLMRAIRGQIRVELELRRYRDELEVRVEERTAELLAVNRALREEVEERIRAQERIEFQARLLDAVEQGVVATDPGGRILFWNRFAETLCGRRAREVAGLSLGEAIAFESHGAEAEDVPSACAARGSWTGEIRVTPAGGLPFPAYLTCSALEGPEGRTEGFVYAFLDATERRRAEEALRYSEEKYSMLVENSPTGIFIVRDGRIVFSNPRLAQMLGYTEQELLHADAMQRICSDDRERVSEIHRRRLEGAPVPEEYECRLNTKTGEVRWVTMRNILVPFRGGVSVLGNVVDITERVKAEEELRETTKALRRLSARLLATQEEERKRLARDLHDSIGQSLSAVKFVVESVVAAGASEERRKAMPVLQAVVPTIRAAVDEVRRISMALRPSTLDDLGLVATIGWFSREFGAVYPNIRVEKCTDVSEEEIPEELKTVIFRILQEALNNVAKHSGARRVWIGLSRVGGDLELRIEDDGGGFSGEASSGSGGGGKGAGIRNMRERAELSGGVFSLVSPEGKGTAIRAVWPLGVPPAPG